MDNVCNRRLFSIPSKVEMAEEQEYLWDYGKFILKQLDYSPPRFLRAIVNSATPCWLSARRQLGLVV